MNDLNDEREDDEAQSMYDTACEDVRVPAYLNINGEKFEVTEWTGGEHVDEYKLIAISSRLCRQNPWTLHIDHVTREVTISSVDSGASSDHVTDISVETCPQEVARRKNGYYAVPNGVEVGAGGFSTATEVQSE